MIKNKEVLPEKDYVVLVEKLGGSSDEISFISTKNNNATYVYAPYGHLRWYIKDYFPTDLSLRFLNNQLNTKLRFQRTMPVHAKYYKELMLENKEISDIIKEHKIRYLIVADNYVDSINIEKTLIFEKIKLEGHLLFEFEYQ